MINGMNRVASALRYWERRQEVLTNNLANVNTTGFKGERVFGRLVGDALTVVDTRTDFSAGTLRPTQQPLDLALGGEGFFVVQTPNGERLSRGGSFQLDAEGRLTDAGGNPLLAEGGPVVVPPGAKLEIDAGGAIKLGGQPAGQLRLETVPPGTRLQHDAGTHFLPDLARQPLPAEQRQVKQGFLEESNVGTVDSLVDMISVQRAYASVQKAVTTLDGVRSTIVNDLARQS